MTSRVAEAQRTFSERWCIAAKILRHRVKTNTFFFELAVFLVIRASGTVQIIARARRRILLRSAMVSFLNVQTWIQCRLRTLQNFCTAVAFTGRLLLHSAILFVIVVLAIEVFGARTQLLLSCSCGRQDAGESRQQHYRTQRRAVHSNSC